MTSTSKPPCLVSVSVIPVLLQSHSLVPPHLLPHLLESLQVLTPSDLHFLSIIVDDDPSIDIEDDHSDDGDDSKAVSHIPVQDETIEVPPLLRGLRGLLLELISL